MSEVVSVLKFAVLPLGFAALAVSAVFLDHAVRAMVKSTPVPHEEKKWEALRRVLNEQDAKLAKERGANSDYHFGTQHAINYVLNKMTQLDHMHDDG